MLKKGDLVRVRRGPRGGASWRYSRFDFTKAVYIIDRRRYDKYYLKPLDLEVRLPMTDGRIEYYPRIRSLLDRGEYWVLEDLVRLGYSLEGDKL